MTLGNVGLSYVLLDGDELCFELVVRIGQVIF